MIIGEMKALLDFFEDLVPDSKSNRLVWKFCDEKERWVKAHGLFTTIRDRNSKAIKQKNELREYQYSFEECVAKTLYNLTNPSAPFDSDSSYWVLKNAFALANAIGAPTDEIVRFIAPNKKI